MRNVGYGMGMLSAVSFALFLWLWVARTTRVFILRQRASASNGGQRGYGPGSLESVENTLSKGLVTFAEHRAAVTRLGGWRRIVDSIFCGQLRVSSFLKNELFSKRLGF